MEFRTQPDHDGGPTIHDFSHSRLKRTMPLVTRLFARALTALSRSPALALRALGGAAHV
jgi:hypothetical protein